MTCSPFSSLPPSERSFNAQSAWFLPFKIPTRRFSVVAQTTENRLVGILKGKNQALCALKLLSEGGKLENGEQVITSGQDQLYPRGLLIGRIKNLTAPEATSALIDVEPAAALQKLETVAVLLIPREEIRRQYEELVRGEKEKEKERQDKAPDRNR